MNTPMPYDWSAGALWRRRFFYAGLAGAALCALGAILDVEQMLRSYLFAYFSIFGIAVGSLALWMLHNLTGGSWGRLLRRTWEAASGTLPWLALLFVPIAVGAPTLFPWAAMDASELGGKASYLNVLFFLARAALYFALWLGLAFLLNRWSVDYERTGNRASVERAQRLSGPGLALCGLGVSFAAIDWVMSLEPAWYSTIFGALIAAGFLLLALAFSVVVTTWLPKTRLLTELGSPDKEETDTWNDLGNLLLAFVMVWTYFAFSQFLLIWSGNLPEEIVWYLRRTEGGWQWLGLALAIGYFALPFCLLLSHGIKRDPKRLRAVALLLVAMSVLDVFWLIAPAFSPSVLRVHWMDLAALAAVGGLWLASFLRQLQARPIVPIQEESVVEELHHA